MKVRAKAFWWGGVLALIVLLVGVRVIFRDDPTFGALFAILILGFIALFIAIPVAEALSGVFVNKILRVNKGKVSKDYSRAKWLVTQERFAEAVEEFRKALDEEPENISIRMEIAEILSRDLKDFGQAISELEACLQLPVSEAQGASILNRIADIQEESLGESHAAVATLRRIPERWPGTKAAERAEQRIRALRQTSGGAWNHR